METTTAPTTEPQEKTDSIEDIRARLRLIPIIGDPFAREKLRKLEEQLELILDGISIKVTAYTESCHSEQLDDLLDALAEAQLEYDEVKRNKKGQKGNQVFMYAEMGQIFAATKPALCKRKIVVWQGHELKYAGDLSAGLCACEITIKTTMRRRGQFIHERMVLRSASSNEQEVGKIITYGKRYSYSSLVGVAAEEDVESDGKAPKKEQQPEQQAPRQQQQQQGGREYKQISTSAPVPTNRQQQPQQQTQKPADKPAADFHPPWTVAVVDKIKKAWPDTEVRKTELASGEIAKFLNGRLVAGLSQSECGLLSDVIDNRLEEIVKANVKV